MNIYGLWVGNWTVSRILSILWNEGSGAYSQGTPTGPKIHVTKCALRNKYMVYGWASEWMPRYYAFYEMKGVGHAPGDHLGSQDPCHLMCLIIRNKIIYGLGRIFWTLSYAFSLFLIRLCDQIWPWPKIGQGHPRVTIMQFMMALRPRCYIPSFMQIRPAVPEKIFKGFLPYVGMAAILVMWPGPHMQTFVPHPMEAPHEILLQSAQWFQRRRGLKMWTHDTQTDRQTDTDNSLAIW